MKVSDPIIFGHAVRAFFPKTFAKYGDALAAAGLNPNDGLGAILKRPGRAARAAREIKASFDAELAAGPAAGDGRLRPRHHQPARAERRHRRRLDAGHDPHLRPHVGPGRQGGRHAGRHPGQQLRRRLPGRHRRLPRARRLRPGHDGLGAERRPDGAGGRGVRQPRQDLRDRRPHGTVRVVDAAGNVVLEQPVSAGDIFRMCQTKDVPIRDWVKLAVNRARATGDPAVFWLDEDRAARRQPDRQGQGVPARARHRRPADRDHVAGAGDRVLAGAHPPRREHHLGHRQRAARLPDRPVPDPGARHQRQDAVDRAADRRRRAVRDGRRRLRAAGTSSSCSRRTTCAGTAWASSSRWRPASSTWPQTTGNARAQILADTLDRATGTFLNEDKSPSRSVGGIDNRGSHFYLALYWAQELARQTDDAAAGRGVRGPGRERSPSRSRRSSTS